MGAYVYGIPPTKELFICGIDSEIPDKYTPCKVLHCNDKDTDFIDLLICVPKTILKKSLVGKGFSNAPLVITTSSIRVSPSNTQSFTGTTIKAPDNRTFIDINYVASSSTYASAGLVYELSLSLAAVKCE